MYFDDPYFGLLLDSPAGHVPLPCLSTTVNPGDTLLKQPDGVLHDVAGSFNFAGYPAVPGIFQETLQSHPPACLSQSMNHPLDMSLDINDDLTNQTRQFTGAVRPVRQMYRGVRVDGPVSTSCQWQPLGSLVCGQEIRGDTVSAHLADHGIRNMRRDLIAQCCWRGCGAVITRQSITRHLREVHLGLRRRSCARVSSRTLVADVY